MKNIISLQDSVINKLFKSGYGFHNYPKDLKYIKKINSKILKKNIIQPFFKDNSYQKKILIHLPSKLVKKTPSFFWKSVVHLKDIEDQASAHRWIWAYELLNSDFYDKKEKFKAINCLVNNWFYFFGNKKIDKNNVMYESYTISERLTNYVILLKLGFIKKNNLHLNSLNKQLLHLTENLEFYYKKKSNHLLNNIRAILIYSNYTKQIFYFKFAYKILKKVIFDFIDKNGFFKFGSSHYQFIFTKWILDIFLFTNNNKFIKNIILRALNACNFFIVKKGQNISIPLFGNVSPDISPKFISIFINNIIHKKKDKNNKKIFFNKYIDIFLKKKINLNFKKINNNSEWKKLENQKIIVFSRNPEITGFNFNHSHNDYFHFILFYEKEPVIIDSGRKSYIKKDEIYKLSEFHNSFLINGKNILDNLVNANTLKNLLSSIYFKYTTKHNRNTLYINGINKFFRFKRDISIGPSWVSIINKFKMNVKSNVCFRLHINNNIALKKNSSGCKMILKKKKSLIKFKTNQNFTLKTKSLKKVKNFEKYGDKIEHQLIYLVFKNVNKVNLEIKIKFL